MNVPHNCVRATFIVAGESPHAIVAGVAIVLNFETMPMMIASSVDRINQAQLRGTGLAADRQLVGFALVTL